MVGCKDCKYMEVSECTYMKLVYKECTHENCFKDAVNPFEGRHYKTRDKDYKQLNKDGDCKLFEPKTVDKTALEEHRREFPR